MREPRRSPLRGSATIASSTLQRSTEEVEMNTQSSAGRSRDPQSHPLAHDAVPAPRGGAAAVPAPADAELLEHELLIEDVSIDGMCGVY
jgi:mycofactocin precursor